MDRERRVGRFLIRFPACLRQASPCIRMNAFCASVNFDAFIVVSSSRSRLS